MSSRIAGTVRCVELAEGPVVVSAHPAPSRGSAAAAQVNLPEGPGGFVLEVPPGAWWIEAVLEQPSIPGAREISAWSHDAVEVADGDVVDGVEIVLEVPETVR
ncbi:MAG: hypothetical protein AB1416_09215 [Actinomycetota bacterium]